MLRFDIIFEHLRIHSSLAQSVEHSAVNRVVVGSSPTGGAMKKPRSKERGFFNEIRSYGTSEIALLWNICFANVKYACGILRNEFYFTFCEAEKFTRFWRSQLLISYCVAIFILSIKIDFSLVQVFNKIFKKHLFYIIFTVESLIHYVWDFCFFICDYFIFYF